MFKGVNNSQLYYGGIQDSKDTVSVLNDFFVQKYLNTIKIDNQLISFFNGVV